MLIILSPLAIRPATGNPNLFRLRFWEFLAPAKKVRDLKFEIWLSEVAGMLAARRSL
jgi:hypothetical protein